jgi:NTP pyrophosphatase (non-canonical NTP hydrolase)
MIIYDENHTASPKAELKRGFKIHATGNISLNPRFGRTGAFSVKLPHMDPQTLTLAAFQKHIKDRYEAVDRARGTPKTWMWFIEEVGELSHALAKADDRPNLEEEFADVLAWLCTLANINDVDLAKVLIDKYLSEKAPEGHK